MNNLFGQILGFLTSPIGWIILVGLAGGLGRAATWVREQRVQRSALQARARLASESLRTGRPTPMNALERVAVPTPAPTRAQTAARKTAELRAAQELRTAQLRALQQKRLAELRARRAQQQGQALAKAQGQTPTQSQPRVQGQGQAPPARPPQTRARSAAPVSRAGPRAGARPPISSGSRPLSTPAPPMAARPRPEVSGRAAPAPFAPAFLSVQERTDRAADLLPGRGISPTGFAANLITREDLRRAVIAGEVLGLPLALREPDQQGLF